MIIGEGLAGAYQCHHQGGNQLFIYLKTNQIQTINNFCLDVDTDQVVFKECKENKISQEWLYKQSDASLKSAALGKCLILTADRTIGLAECDKYSPNQKWTMDNSTSNEEQ